MKTITFTAVLFLFSSSGAFAQTCSLRAGGVATLTNPGTLCTYPAPYSNNPDGASPHVIAIQQRGDRYAVVQWDLGVPSCFFDYTSAAGRVTLALLMTAWASGTRVQAICWDGATWRDEWDGVNEFRAVARIVATNVR